MHLQPLGVFLKLVFMLLCRSFVADIFDQRALYSVLSYIQYIFLIDVFYNFHSRPVVCFVRHVLKSPFLTEDRRIRTVA